MSESKKSIPRRRFKGFEGAKQWKQSFFLGVIINIIDFRGRTPKKLGMDWSVCGFLALSALNVKNGYIDFSADAHYGDNNLYLKWMGGNELRKGQVIFTTEAPMGNVAQIPDDNGYILSQRVIAFEVNKAKITDDFLAISLKSPNVYNSLLMMTSGGTAKGISQKSLSTLKIHLPSSITEQTQIGEFFKKLDNLISTQQKKLEKAKTLKLAYLTEMFPNEGELKPRLRFNSFINAWHIKDINDLANRYDNLRIPITASNRKVGLTPYYGANGIQDYVQGFTHDGEYILIAEDGANDFKNYPVQYVKGKIWVNNHAHVLQGKIGICNNKFLMNAFKNINIEPYLVGGSRAKLNSDTMMNISLKVPNITEQTKIGNFFKLLDDKIALEQKKLNKLKNIKQAYLNEMFV